MDQGLSPIDREGDGNGQDVRIREETQPTREVRSQPDGLHDQGHEEGPRDQGAPRGRLLQEPHEGEEGTGAQGEPEASRRQHTPYQDTICQGEGGSQSQGTNAAAHGGGTVSEGCY